MERLTVAEIGDLETAWESTPPQAVSLLWVRIMMGGFFGIDTGYGQKPEPLPVTPAAVEWMQKQLEGMTGGSSQEVFQALQEMEREVSCGG